MPDWLVTISRPSPIRDRLCRPSAAPGDQLDLARVREVVPLDDHRAVAVEQDVSFRSRSSGDARAELGVGAGVRLGEADVPQAALAAEAV